MKEKISEALLKTFEKSATFYQLKSRESFELGDQDLSRTYGNVARKYLFYVIDERNSK